MLSKYQLMIADLYDISIGTVEKLIPNVFDKQKYVLHYNKLQLYLRLGLKLKNAACIRMQSITMTKTVCGIQYTKINK